MAPPDAREGRPTSTKVEAATVSAGNLDTHNDTSCADVARCKACGARIGARITARESLAVELGRVCRRRQAVAA